MKKIFLAFLLTLTFSVAKADTVSVTGWQTGHYDAVLNGVPIKMVCIDYLRTGPAVSSSYDATISTLPNIANTRQPGLLANYIAATWLYDQMLNPANDGLQGQIQSAMWGLLTPSYGYDPSPGSWAMRALSATQFGWDVSPYIIITPNGTTGNGTQEMIARMTAPVPEPATLLLLGSGLAGLASLLKKRNREDSTV